MPTLPQRLKPRLRLLLIGFLVFAALALMLADLARAPERQLLASLYLRAVSVYQRHGSPLTEGYVACRYTPTCSQYSKLAVERFGLAQGLRLTIRRVSSCQSAVPYGTEDPVPAASLPAASRADARAVQ